MTLVFFGSILNTNRENKMNFIESHIKLFEKKFSKYILEFDEYSLFPESKENLIVMKLKCTNSNFINDIIKYKQLFCSIGAPNENYFTPHITLGKLKKPKTTSIWFQSFVKQIPIITSNVNITSCHLV